MAGEGARWGRRIGAVAASLVAAYLLLLIPDCEAEVPEAAGHEPFVWDQDERWAEAERAFGEARRRGCEALGPELRQGIADAAVRVEALDGVGAPVDDPRWTEVEAALVHVAPLVAACPTATRSLVALTRRVRIVAKDASRGWDLGDRRTRDRLYRLLYLGRLAVEEVLLQQSAAESAAFELVRGVDEPSATPSVEIHGVRVHSGDILVSRGGAPTSAMIARGNDYPGNFSHVALAHVSEDGVGSVIESHIEVGVVISTVEVYLRDKKLRLMLLRPRADLPELVAEPMLPHTAATAARDEVLARHIPYDFAMDYRDHSLQFCSEVASAAYEVEGVELWEGLTSMSSLGTVAWLSAFGVTTFETHGPSDLEYDPKLRVVAEFRARDVLFDDHVDNAIIDTLLTSAEAGERVGYDHSQLPMARLAKAYSLVLNLFGEAGPVPEGMSATTALRIGYLRERHGEIRDGLLSRVEEYEREHEHPPAYWTLVDMARQSDPRYP